MTKMSRPKVSVYGSFPKDLRYPAMRTLHEFCLACRMLGETLAAEGFHLVVCSALEDSADRNILEGALPVFASRADIATVPVITWMRSAVGGPHNAYFETLSLQHPHLF